MGLMRAHTGGTLAACLGTVLSIIAFLSFARAGDAHIVRSDCFYGDPDEIPEYRSGLSSCMPPPFVFKGKMSKGDPVNLVFVGGREGLPGEEKCARDFARSPECVEKHFNEAWKAADREMKARLCDGGADLAFYVGSRYDDATGFPRPRYRTGESNKSLTTSSTCEDEYHVRIWGDQYHGHNIDRRQWAVGAIHHEKRCKVPGFCKHEIDYNWEFVEDQAVFEFKTRHEGEVTFCAEADYYPLRASNPPGRSKSHYRTGFPSRISFQAIDRSAERGRRCRGA